MPEGERTLGDIDRIPSWRVGMDAEAREQERIGEAEKRGSSQSIIQRGIRKIREIVSGTKRTNTP